MSDGWERRDGRWYRVTRLPDATAPRGRSKRTRYRMADVDKPGNIAEPNRSKPRPAPVGKTKFPFLATIKAGGRQYTVEVLERGMRLVG